MSAVAPAHLFNSIPQRMRAIPQWVAWKLVQKPNKPKPDKIPINPASLQYADVTDPSTYGTFEQALAAHLEHPQVYPGIGFVFTKNDPFAFIDLDDVKTADGWDPLVAKTLEQIPSWTEYSQSGNGIHIICEAEGPASASCKDGALGIEFYTTGRFVAMTGRHHPTTPKDITACQAGCDWLRAEIKTRGGKDKAGSSAPPTDHEALAVERNLTILQRKAGKWEVECPWGHEHGNGDPGGAVYMLAHNNSRKVSNFDCRHATCQGKGRANIGALRSWLANKDPEYGTAQVVQVFGPEGSDRLAVPGLVSSESVIAAAVAAAIEGIESAANLNIDAIPARPWLYGRRVLRGYVTILHGPGGVGKSMFALVDALAMASGQSLMGAGVKADALNVLYMCNEDDITEIARRLAAASIHHKIDLKTLKGRLDIKSGYDYPETLYDASDSPEKARARMQAWLKTCRKAGYDVVIMDPLISLYRGLAENANDEMELVMEIIRGLTKKADIGLVVVAHNRKGGGEEGHEDDLRGASAQKDAARITYSLTRMSRESAMTAKIDWEQYGRHLVRMDSGKANFSPSDANADWYQLHDVRIPSGDHVGVPTPVRLDDLRPAVAPEMPEAWEVMLETILEVHAEFPDPWTTVLESHVSYARVVDALHGALASAGFVPPVARTLERYLLILTTLTSPFDWLRLSDDEVHEYRLRNGKLDESKRTSARWISIEKRPIVPESLW